MAMPTAIRPTIKTSMLVPTAHKIDPTAKMHAVPRIARLRPITSVSLPLRVEPQTAPIRAALTRSSSVNGVSPNSPLMKRIAPEITPVSKPNSSPASAAIAAVIEQSNWPVSPTVPKSELGDASGYVFSVFLLHETGVTSNTLPELRFDS